MVSKSWRLVVTELGQNAPISDALVDAGNWMTALSLARAAIGESGTVPPGASCSVAPDGQVTIHDGVERKTYLLSPHNVGDEETSLMDKPPPKGPTVPSEPAPQSAKKDDVAPTPAKKEKLDPKRTMAYDANSLGLSAAAEKAKAESNKSAPTAKVSTRTVAYNAADLGVLSSPTPEKKSEPVSKRTVAYNAADLGLPTAPETPTAEPTAPEAAESLPKKKMSTRTVAYNVKDMNLARPRATAPKIKIATNTIAYNANDLKFPQPGTPSQPPNPSKKPPTHTIAYDAKDLGVPLPGTKFPSKTPAAEEKDPAQSGTPAIAPKAATSEAVAAASLSDDAKETLKEAPLPRLDRPTDPDGFNEPGSETRSDKMIELLASRDEEPSEETPLCYRERTYVVNEDLADLVLRQLLEAKFDTLQEELSDRPKGKLVNMAFFDHKWTDRPKRPPLITLQWKDWRGEPVIKHGPRSLPPPPAETSSPPRAAAPTAPKQEAAPSAELSLDIAPAEEAGRKRTGTEPLTTAFEALQDLFFLTAPMDGLSFVLKLLADLIPSEATSACLYDINEDELRFVAVTGVGADERKAEGVPRMGLMGAAAAQPGRAIVLDDVASDGRFDPGIDGRLGLTARTMALVAVMHQGRLLGILQLINREKKPRFTREDANILLYVSGKLGEFLFQARMRSEEKRA